MRIFQGYSQIDQKFNKPIITIGNYDGLHLGHREIISAIVNRARQEHGTSVVYTFRPHPHLALTPNEELQLINTYDEKLELLAELGVDVVVEQPFSREFSEISAENFFKDILVKRLLAHAVYVGYDFGFGRNRTGSLDLLRQMCQAQGIEVHVTQPRKIDGETCSSTRVREYLKCGDVSSANKLLGRNFFYRGLVVRGNGRGHKLGFATANVHTESKLRVKEGVYATWAIYKGQRFQSVTNVGRRPTFNADESKPVTVETHILEFDQDIYGETLEVQMVQRIRDEIRFANVEQLVIQIKKDVVTAKEYLG
jgi:riboflavin kinase/FMN adenylyltransferase